MSTEDVWSPANARERRDTDGQSGFCPGSSLEDAVLDDLALMLHRAALLMGGPAEQLLASLSDADLAALYLIWAEEARKAIHPHGLEDRRCIAAGDSSAPAGGCCGCCGC